MIKNNLINVHCPTGVAKFPFINISLNGELKFIHSNVVIHSLNYIPSVFIEYAIASSSLN